MFRRKLLALGIGLLLPVILLLTDTSPASAQVGLPDGFEQIGGYDVDITIATNGDLSIVETISYDFGSQERHGIDRIIPVVSRYDKHNDRIYPLDVESVTASSATPSQYEVSDYSETEKRIRIGDPDTTITGTHTYVITYFVRGALNAFGDHDELFWNAIGDEWSSPISNINVRVHSPGDITQVACYAGPSGSRLGCGSAGATGKEASFAHPGLNPFEATTIVVAMNKGVISPEPAPILRKHWTFDQAFAVTPATVGISSALMLGLLIFVGWLGYTRGRDRRAIGSHVDAAFATGNEDHERVPFMAHTETPVEFEPPDGIRPGQIGVLIDERAHPLDATATIVDLAVRGYLCIEETQERGWFKKGDWKLTKLKEPDDLLEYERILLNGLFESGDEVQLSELRTRFAARLAKVASAMHKDVVAKGWFTEDPDKTRRRWNAIGWLVVLAGIGATVLAAIFTGLGLIPIPIIFAGFVLTKVAKRMPHRTAKGTAVLGRVLGFKRLIESPTEVGHAKFNEQNNLFSAYLPFAIVFGCTEKWAEAFEGLDVELSETTTWYRSSDPFSPIAFSNSIGYFSTMSTGTFAAAAPSSSGGSGFSGGGSSGGGGGGGGGGSW